MLIRPPDVYRPQSDTWLLARAMADAAIPPASRVLDACTGTGALAIAAASAGATSVTAVDISRAAIATAWLNSRLRGQRLELVRGDFARVLRDRAFDVVLANPPYVPAPEATPVRGSARTWHGGRNGRKALNVLCGMLPRLLNRQGIGLIVHSALADPGLTLDQLHRGGLKAAVVARDTIPFGPVLHRQAPWLESVGLIEPGQRHEELVVIRADHIRR